MARDPDDLLAPGDLAKHLGVSRRTVQRMLRAGQLPPATLHVGRSPRWRWAAVRLWLRVNAVVGGPASRPADLPELPPKPARARKPGGADATIS